MLVLFGPPGVGKSTLGRALAHQVNLPLFDIDDLLEEKMGQSRQHLWCRLGEKRYRTLESDIVQALNPGIIACGGGTILDTQNVHHLQKLGKLLYLTCPLDILIKRAFATPRALFQTEAEFVALYEQRIPHYEKIKAIRIDTSLSMDLILKKILTLYM